MTGGMMGLFARNPDAAAAKVESHLAAIQAKVATLQADRARALLEFETTEEVAKIDAAIASQERAAAIHRDRIAALRAEARRQRQEQAAAEKREAIAELERRLDGQIKLAERLEAAIRELGEATRALVNSRASIITNWPSCLERPAASDFRLDGLRREYQWAMFAAGNPRAGKPCDIFGPSNEGLGVTGVVPLGVAGFVRAAAAGFLDRLRHAPLLEDDDQEAAA